MATLEEMARQKFTDPPLSAAEERVVQNAPDGTVANCIDLGGGDDPEKADGTPEAPDERWPETRNVRADLIRWLFVDREAREQIDPKGVWIEGARITGDLDLSFTNLLFPLILLSCRLEQNLDLTGAKMPLLNLGGSWTGAIDADGLKLEGSLFLRNGFHAEGEVRLLGATIGGTLDAEGGAFKNLNGNALNADRIKVTGGVFLRNGFSAEGEVRLPGATIGGDLDATGGTFKNSNGRALNADSTKIGRNVFFKQWLDGEAVVKKKFVAEGEVVLLGATIGGTLEADGGTFKNLNGNALTADRIKVTGGVYLRNGFSAEGEVRLPGATIGGDLSAEGGTFKNLNGNALNADRISVTGSVFLRNGFSAEGEVRLLGATIGGDLSATGGTFKNLKSDKNPNSTGDALSADGIKVTGNISLSDKFAAEGEVRLPGAQVNGQLGVDDAWLDELNLESARVMGPFFWQNIHKDPHPDFPNKEWKPSLDLTNAKVGALADPVNPLDPEASWPEKGRLFLDGFVYDRISAGPTDAAARLKWIGLQRKEDGYRPQPYEQLIAVLRRMGHEHQVAKVAIAKQEDLYEHGDLGRWGKVRSSVLYHAVRYGYEPWRAFMWIFFLVVFGSCVFACARYANALVPSDEDAYTEYENPKMGKVPKYYPDFQAPLYSLDVVLPFDLGQKSNWRLHQRWTYDFVYWIFEVYSLFQLIVGWVLLLIAAAVPAGLIK